MTTVHRLWLAVVYFCLCSAIARVALEDFKQASNWLLWLDLFCAVFWAGLTIEQIVRYARERA